MKKPIILLIAIKCLLFSLIEMSLFCQTPLITNVKQIKSSVRDEIVSTSNDFVSLKNDVASSTNALSVALSSETQARIDAITNLNVALSSETQARTNTDNILTSQIQSLQAQSTNYVLRGGDTLNGNYTFNGNIQANKYFGDGSNLTIYPYTTNYFHLGDTDAYGRKRLWFYDTNSVLKLGGATSDGDPVNANSEGIVVINNTNDNMARIKADRFGLTRASDSSYYFFRADPSSLYYKSTDTTNTRFYIDNNSGNIGIGTTTPQAKLDISGNIRITDGTQGAGKVLTSDANGLASWQTPAGGSGDNLGNHIATTTLNMNNKPIENASYVNIVGNLGLQLNGNTILKTQSNDNLFLGEYSGNNFYNGISNTFLGKYSGYNFNSGDTNLFLGLFSGYNFNNGNNNIFLGNNSGLNLSIGYNNIFIGNQTNSPSGTIDNFLNIGNIIYGRNITGNGNGNIGIGTPNPSAKLDINGNIRIADGTQGAGKVLTSDDNGLASWQTPAGGSGDNLGNHLATTTLNMSGNDIINVGKIYTQDWSDIPISTNGFTGHIYYKTLGDQTCLEISFQCSNNVGCSNIPYYIGSIPPQFSTNLPIFIIATGWITDYSEPPNINAYSWAGMPIFVYNNGNIYEGNNMEYGQEYYGNFCFRNKL